MAKEGPIDDPPPPAGRPARRGSRWPELPDHTGDGPEGPAPVGTLGALGRWIRAQPVLAASVVTFCIVAIAGLLVSLPRGILSTGRTSRPPTGASASAPVKPPGDPAPSSPAPSGPTGGAAEPGPWIEGATSAASAHGVSLVYHHRTLPPGGESRFEWVVQLHGARPTLDGIDVVTWRMEPAAKNGAEFE